MADAGTGEKLKIFISYSHRDSAAFADELVAGLELADFAPFLDRHDIAAGEEWETRLGGLIGQADTVVFVVSPEVRPLPVGGGQDTRTVKAPAAGYLQVGSGA
jgi:TIR domain